MANLLRSVFLLAPLLAMLLMAGCEKQQTLTELTNTMPDAKIALVSYSTNLLAGSLDGYDMAPRMQHMHAQAESSLNANWEVIPGATFVPGSAYQALTGNPQGVALPQIDGHPMQVFGADRDQVIAAGLDATSAAALAKLTGADLLAVIYVEWDLNGGMMGAYALAKVVLSVYDAQGQRIFHIRQDKRGVNKLKIVMYQSLVTEENLSEWVVATEAAMADIRDGFGGTRVRSSQTDPGF